VTRLGTEIALNVPGLLARLQYFALHALLASRLLVLNKSLRNRVVWF
jgi:hypothetical protein